MKLQRTAPRRVAIWCEQSIATKEERERPRGPGRSWNRATRARCKENLNPHLSLSSSHFSTFDRGISTQRRPVCLGVMHSDGCGVRRKWRPGGAGPGRLYCGGSGPLEGGLFWGAASPPQALLWLCRNALHQGTYSPASGALQLQLYFGAGRGGGGGEHDTAHQLRSHRIKPWAHLCLQPAAALLSWTVLSSRRQTNGLSHKQSGSKDHTGR